jgi:hypothetical protein
MERKLPLFQPMEEIACSPCQTRGAPIARISTDPHRIARDGASLRVRQDVRLADRVVEGVIAQMGQNAAAHPGRTRVSSSFHYTSGYLSQIQKGISLCPQSSRNKRSNSATAMDDASPFPPCSSPSDEPSSECAAHRWRSAQSCFANNK